MYDSDEEDGEEDAERDDERPDEVSIGYDDEDCLAMRQHIDFHFLESGRSQLSSSALT